MWNREAAVFAAYASVIVYGLSVLPSLLTENPSAPSSVNALMMVPLTLATVYIIAVQFLRRRRLNHQMNGAALGAFSAFSVYCVMVFCMMILFYSSLDYWTTQGKTGHIPGAIGLYAIVLSPVLMPAALFVGASAGMVYVHFKFLLGFACPVTQGPQKRRRRRISTALVLTAMVAIAIPSMIFLGGLPALMLIGSLVHQ